VDFLNLSGGCWTGNDGLGGRVSRGVALERTSNRRVTPSRCDKSATQNVRTVHPVPLLHGVPRMPVGRRLHDVRAGFETRDSRSRMRR
jgi:hypothetical protein